MKILALRLVHITIMFASLAPLKVVGQTSPDVAHGMPSYIGTPAEKYTINNTSTFKVGPGQGINGIGRSFDNAGGSYIQRGNIDFLLSIPTNSELVGVELTYKSIDNSQTDGNSKIAILNLNYTNNPGSWFSYLYNAQAFWQNISNRYYTSTHYSSATTNSTLFNKVKSLLSSTNNRISFSVTLMNDEQANYIYKYNLSLVLVVKQRHFITVRNSTNTGVVYVDQGNGFAEYSSGTQLNLLLNQSIQLKSNSIQEVNGIDWNFAHWSDSPTNFQTANPYTLKVTKDAVWTATYEGPVSIVFANKEGSNNLSGSKLLLDNTDEINSGETRYLIKDTQHTIKTQHETWDNKRIKQNNWNDVATNYKLLSPFTAIQNLDFYEAKYFELKPVGVTTAVEGISMPGPIEFLDPWFVEPDGSQPENNWKSYPNGVSSSTHVNGGLFLQSNQNPNTPSFPYYIARASDKTIINGISSVFLNWTGPTNTVYSPELLETPIVFRNSSDVITANYKAILGSNTSGWVNGNQYVSYNGTSSVLYKSNNQLWLHTEDGNSQAETLIEESAGSVAGYSVVALGTNRFWSYNLSDGTAWWGVNDQGGNNLSLPVSGTVPVTLGIINHASLPQPILMAVYKSGTTLRYREGTLNGSVVTWGNWLTFTLSNISSETPVQISSNGTTMYFTWLYSGKVYSVKRYVAFSITKWSSITMLYNNTSGNYLSATPAVTPTGGLSLMLVRLGTNNRQSIGTGGWYTSGSIQPFTVLETASNIYTAYQPLSVSTEDNRVVASVGKAPDSETWSYHLWRFNGTDWTPYAVNLGSQALKTHHGDVDIYPTEFAHTSGLKLMQSTSITWPPQGANKISSTSDGHSFSIVARPLDDTLEYYFSINPSELDSVVIDTLGVWQLAVRAGDASTELASDLKHVGRVSLSSTGESITFIPNRARYDYWVVDPVGNKFRLGRDGESGQREVTFKHSVSIYPNPFNPATTFRVTLAAPETISVKVFNLLGQEVAVLASGWHDTGEYAFQFNASTLASGVYVYQVQIGREVQTGKLQLLK